MNLGGELSFFLGAFAALLTIVNPFSTASIFLTITRGDSKRKKRTMVKKACWTAFFVLLIFAILGSYILSFFSITIDAFKIAGGILVTGVGLRMVRAKREHLPTEREKKAAADKEDISVIPLAIPMMSGPGAMATALVLMGSAETTFSSAMVLLAIISVILISYFVLVNASIVDKYLKESGKRVADRIMGLIVLVVGVQFIIDGVEGVVLSWGL
jgi:multiple antibiotic resistance protein